MRKEVDRQFKEKCLDVDTVILWILHKQFGFGPIRLRKYFDAYILEVKKQQEKYKDLTAEKMREALKHNIGVDVEAWEREA